MLPKTPQVRWVVVLVCVLAAVPALAQSLGTAFTYQGRLTDGGSPATGAYDLQLVLYDAAVGGSQVGPILARDDVAVTNGLFTVSLDFGGVFAGSQRWLEIRVRPGASTGAYSTLSPRQELAPSPNAVFSASAPWAGINGKPAGFRDDIDNDLLAGLSCADGQLAKWNGASWACAADADTIGWGLTGNAGTNPATNFIGTTDDVPLELRVNNQRALRLEQVTTIVGANTYAGANVLGGSSNNSITSGVTLATIAGGGGTNYVGPYPNTVTDVGGTVGGGWGNRAGDNAGTLDNSLVATVAGGGFNTASGWWSAVAGGYVNTASGGASAVAGGYLNTASGEASAVAGGENTASGHYSAVAGGYLNTAGGDYSFAAGRQATVRDAAASGDFNGDEGTFAWADSQGAPFASTGPNQFLIRAAGGVGINTNAPAGNAMAVSGNATVTGNVGIGTSDPHTKLHVTGGSVYIGAPNSLILTSPNGNCWFITVNDAGGLGSFQIPCP